MTEPRKPIDWEAIEREYRAGQLSIREIARRFDASEAAVRKRAKRHGWVRALAEQVREAVREKLVRADGAHEQRASDAAVVNHAAARGFEVVISHRRDLEQLHALKRILATRLSDYLHGVAPDGPCIGDKESPGDLLEKLSRVTSRLIPLTRQAFNLDANPDDPATVKIESDAAFSELVGALEGIARTRARRTGGPGEVAEPSEAGSDNA